MSAATYKIGRYTISCKLDTNQYATVNPCNELLNNCTNQNVYNKYIHEIEEEITDEAKFRCDHLLEDLPAGDYEANVELKARSNKSGPDSRFIVINANEPAKEIAVLSLRPAAPALAPALTH